MGVQRSGRPVTTWNGRVDSPERSRRPSPHLLIHKWARHSSKNRHHLTSGFAKLLAFVPILSPYGVEVSVGVEPEDPEPLAASGQAGGRAHRDAADAVDIIMRGNPLALCQENPELIHQEATRPL